MQNCFYEGGGRSGGRSEFGDQRAELNIVSEPQMLKNNLCKCTELAKNIFLGCVIPPLTVGASSRNLGHFFAHLYIYLIGEYDSDDEDVSQEAHRQNDGGEDQRCGGDILCDVQDATIQTVVIL